MNHFVAPLNGMLTPKMLHSFESDGFLILEDFLTKDTCQNLTQRIASIIQDWHISKALHFYQNEVQRYSPEFIYETCEKLCFFYDAPRTKITTSALSQYLNKITHAIHDLDPYFNSFSRQELIKNLVHSLGYENPLLLQSMYLFKNPDTSQDVSCHQDASYLYTDPNSLVGLWFALEDAHINNGCLWVYRGHHKGPLASRIRLIDTHLEHETWASPCWLEEECIPLEVNQGSLILLHGLLPHLSKANKSLQSRHAYCLHIMDGRSTYSNENWLQRPPSFPFTGF
jgi:phytanoyl-CoA hydroxylase